MISLIIMAFIFTIIIILLSLIFKDFGQKIFVPLIFVMISIILLFVSIVRKGWEGMGLGAVSISLFIAALIALIAIVVLYGLNSKNHQ